jgi:hypothetical protein
MLDVISNSVERLLQIGHLYTPKIWTSVVSVLKIFFTTYLLCIQTLTKENFPYLLIRLR